MTSDTSEPKTTRQRRPTRKTRDPCDDREPTITVSMSRKINLGNYESADVFVALNGVKAGMTEADLRPLLDTGKVAWDLVRRELYEQVKRTRAAKGMPDYDRPA